MTNNTALSFEFVVFKPWFYDADGVELYVDYALGENVEPESTFWLKVYCESPDTPATVKLVGYLLVKTDESGEHEFIVYEDTTTVNPEPLKLR